MKPILFNAKMVRAILYGRKTQTRRINKDGSEFSVPDMSFFDPASRTYAIRNYADYEHQQRTSLVQAPVPICPGDVLYVRETWGKLKYPDGSARYVYKASDEYPFGEEGYIAKFRWHPSIHMPREAARIFLRVTDVRVERLQDIKNADCISEGAVKRPDITKRGDLVLHSRYRMEFADLWDSTIKPADLDRYGWAANPWVWVICFERYDPADPEGGADG